MKKVVWTLYCVLILHSTNGQKEDEKQVGPFTLTLCLTLNCTNIKPVKDTFVLGENQQFRGDPEDLTPEHPSQYLGITPRRPPKQWPVPPPKVWPIHQESKGEKGDLIVAEGRHRPRKQSYSRQYNPKPKHYSKHNRHSDGGKNGKGGYYKSESYNGNQGYASESSFDRAKKDSYADADHQQYGNRDGGHRSGGHQSGGRHGGHGGGREYFGNHGGEYGEDGNSYLTAGDYK